MGSSDNVEPLMVLQPIQVDTASLDKEGRLVIANGKLVAVLVRLDEPEHPNAGGWFVEVAFGRLHGQRTPSFSSLEDAIRWLRQRLSR